MSYLHSFGNTHISEKSKLGRKFILGLIAIAFPYLTFAQSLDIELIRTEHTPGFFAVRIFPDKNLKKIDIEDVFVKNFDESEKETFSDLIPILEELGGRVIEKSVLAEHTIPYNRVILLGGPKKSGFIHFSPETEDVLTEFDDFAARNLKLPTLMDITATFGGNITEVYPPKIPTMSDEPIFFVGKFKAPLKTKMEITALTYDGEIKAITPLKLDIFEQNEFSDSLPAIWEEVYKSTLPTPKTSVTNHRWIMLFPWILGIFGIILTIWAISINTRFNVPIQYKKTQRKQDLGEDLDEIPPGFWHQPKETVDKTLPFEVTSKDD